MKRGKFNLSHYKLCTADTGKLVPLAWYEALPGDSIQQRTSLMVRVSPLLAPVMHPLRIRIHHWFVPNRLIWSDFENFITGGKDGKFVAAPPHFKLASVDEGSLHDHFGVPPGSYPSTNIEFSALPVRAYNLIYNEHYRDQDICAERVVSTASGLDTTTDQTDARISWEKDYFTTARPWPQKGDEVTIPLGDKAPISGIGKLNNVFDGGLQSSIREAGGKLVTYQANENILMGTGGDGNKFLAQEDPDNPGFPNFYADLSEATGISISDLRLALAIQRYQEARAAYGSRYVEYLRYLGVRSSDARLQNPEYLGGGRQVIQFSEVLQTAPGQDSVVGELKGHGVAAMRTMRFRRYFEEHGIVMTLMSVVPKSIYMQGLKKAFNRATKEDYFQKELQFIGDQTISNREIQATHTDPAGTFGYQNRYDEYRSHPSWIAGEFRSILNHWHYGREFSGDVALNESFLSAVPTDRVYASTNTDPLYIMCNHSIQARRMVHPNPTPRTF